MVETILEEMKNAGFKSAIVKKDGHIFKTNFQFDDPLPSVFSSLVNVCDALMAQANDSGIEYELAIGEELLFVIPLKDYYMITVTDSKEKKKDIREFSKKINEKL